MSEQTKIAWTDSTVGPWLICTEVSPGCVNCYSRELMINRLKTIARKAFKAAGFKDWETRPVWGKTAPRILTRGFQGKMLAMNRRPFICDNCGDASANITGPTCKCRSKFHRRRSFPSLIDWLDDMPAGIIDQDGNKLDPIAVLADFLDTLRQCDQMVHILCTKRPENFFPRIEAVAARITDHSRSSFVHSWIHGFAPTNIILLTSVENQEQADKRIPELLKIPATCRGLSLEPLLGPVNVGPYILSDRDKAGFDNQFLEPLEGFKDKKIKWCIAGGESGPKARPCDVSWIRSIVQDCNECGCPCFVKQLGARPIVDEATPDGWPVGTNLIPRTGETALVDLRDKKGGDPAEWSPDLRVQQWPCGF
jgi:protein gp37